jgi:4-hydroxy-tetrahydrodipicolinate synthase
MSRASLERQHCGPDFILLSGEDATALGFNAHGGRGCISVTSNVAPALCAAFQAACQGGQYAKALELQDRLMPLHEALFVETSPGPVKYAVSRLGLCTEEVRLPLAPISERTKQVVDAAMRHAGLMQAAAAE